MSTRRKVTGPWISTGRFVPLGVALAGAACGRIGYEPLDWLVMNPREGGSSTGGAGGMIIGTGVGGSTTTGAVAGSGGAAGASGTSGTVDGSAPDSSGTADGAAPEAGPSDAGQTCPSSISLSGATQTP